MPLFHDRMANRFRANDEDWLGVSRAERSEAFDFLERFKIEFFDRRVALG